jgi:hypothetical protein
VKGDTRYMKIQNLYDRAIQRRASRGGYVTAYQA